MVHQIRSVAEWGEVQINRRWRLLALWAIDILALTFVVAFVYRDFLFHGRHLVAPIDGTYMLYPFEHFIAEHLRSGELPLWLPNNVSGFPTAGFPQYGIFYPLRWIFWLWPAEGGFSPLLYGAGILLHTWLSAVTMYALVMQLGWHRAGAVAAGVAWSIAPNALAYSAWANAMPAFAWWPLTVLFLVRLERSGPGRWRNSALAGLCLGLTILAAPAQPAIQLLAIVGLLFLVQAIGSHDDVRAHLVRVSNYTVVGVIGLGLGAVTLLPIFEFARHSIRFLGPFGGIATLGRMSMEAFTHFHFEPRQIPGLVVSELSREKSGFFEYLGPFLFCAAGFGYAALARRREQAAICAAVLIVVALLYMFNAGLPALFYELPLLKMIREPAYYASFLLFGACLLGAYGIDWLLREQSSTTVATRTALALSAVLVALGVVASLEHALSATTAAFLALAIAWSIGFGITRGPVTKNVFAVLGCCLMAANFALVSNPTWVGTGDADFEHRMAASQVLRSLAPPATDPQRTMFYRSGESATGPVWYPNIAELTGFADIFGYANPILRAPFQAFLWARQYRQMLSLLDVRNIVTDAAGVAGVQAAYGVNPANASIISSVPTLDLAHQPIKSDLSVFRYDQGLRHAWLRTHYEVMASPWATNDPPMQLIPELGRVLEPTFDLSSMVILDRTPDSAGPAVDPAGPAPSGRISWSDYRPNHLEVDVTSDRPAILTISEVAYPGWRAEVNGDDAPVYRAYGMLRAVIVPAGASKVAFSFVPPSLWYGALISLITLLMVVVLLAVPARDRRA